MNVFIDTQCVSHCSEDAYQLQIDAVRNRDALIDFWVDSFANSHRRSLWDTATHANLAADAIARSERFPGEQKLANDYLKIDVPRLRLRDNASLHILELGSRSMRFDFVTYEAARERLIRWVISKGGIYYRRHRNDNPGSWMELVS
jgi:hypothetical protein